MPPQDGHNLIYEVIVHHNDKKKRIECNKLYVCNGMSVFSLVIVPVASTAYSAIGGEPEFRLVSFEISRAVSVEVPAAS